MDTQTATEREFETWVESTGTTPGLFVERQREYDSYSAILDRAALAAASTLALHTHKISVWDSAHDAIEAALFPAAQVGPIDGFLLHEYMPIEIGHTPVVANYDDCRIELRVDRKSSFSRPGWWFPSEGRLALACLNTAPDVATRFLHAVGLESLRACALAAADDLQELVQQTLKFGNEPEREALARWGLLRRPGKQVEWVYFIRRGEDGPIKIGWSRSPVGRMAQLQTGQEVQLHLLAMAPGGSREESELHRRFASSRMVGEWFKATPMLCAYVRQVRSQGVL